MGEMMLGGIPVYVEQVDAAQVHRSSPGCLYTEGLNVIVWDYLSSRVRMKVGGRGATVPFTNETC